MSLDSLAKRARQKPRAKRRIDCRWCGSTNFVDAFWIFYCPQCQAKLPDYFVSSLYTLEVILVAVLLNLLFALQPNWARIVEEFWLWKSLVQRYKDIGNFLHLSSTFIVVMQIWVIIRIILKRADFLFLRIHLPLLGFWGWTYQSKTTNWICSPTQIPESYILRELYLTLIRPIGITTSLLSLTTGIVSLLLTVPLHLVPLPDQYSDIYVYTKHLIILTALIGLLVGLVPHKSVINRLIGSITMFLAAILLLPEPLAIYRVTVIHENPDYASFLGIIKLIIVIPIMVVFIGSVFSGLQLSFFFFGITTPTFITIPIPAEIMPKVRTKPTLKKYWLDASIENELSESQKKIDRLLRVVITPLFLLIYKFIQGKIRKGEEELRKAGAQVELINDRDEKEKILNQKLKELEEWKKEAKDWEEIKKGYLFALRQDKDGNFTKPILFMPRELCMLIVDWLQKLKAETQTVYFIEMKVRLSYQQAFTSSLFALTELNGYELVTGNFDNGIIVAQTLSDRLLRSEYVTLELKSVENTYTEIKLCSQCISKVCVWDMGKNKRNVTKLKKYFENDLLSS